MSETHNAPRNRAAVALGRRGGRSTSERKRQAAQANLSRAREAARAAGWPNLAKARAARAKRIERRADSPAA